MSDVAFLEVRVLPWRPRQRRLHPDTLRDLATPDLSLGGDDLAGVAVGLALSLALWLAVVVAAPLLVVLLAWLLFAVELPLLIVVALALMAVRVAGVVPWTVVTVDGTTGRETVLRTRSLRRAVRVVRGVNGGRRMALRWALF